MVSVYCHLLWPSLFLQTLFYVYMLTAGLLLKYTTPWRMSHYRSRSRSQSQAKSATSGSRSKRAAAATPFSFSDPPSQPVEKPWYERTVKISVSCRWLAKDIELEVTPLNTPYCVKDMIAKKLNFDASIFELYLGAEKMIDSIRLHRYPISTGTEPLDGINYYLLVYTTDFTHMDNSWFSLCTCSTACNSVLAKLCHD